MGSENCSPCQLLVEKLREETSPKGEVSGEQKRYQQIRHSKDDVANRFRRVTAADLRKTDTDESESVETCPVLWSKS